MKYERSCKRGYICIIIRKRALIVIGFSTTFGPFTFLLPNVIVFSTTFGSFAVPRPNVFGFPHTFGPFALPRSMYSVFRIQSARLLRNRTFSCQ